MQRMLNQGARLKRLEEIINKGLGTDNYTGKPLMIPNQPVEVEHFTNELVDMVNKVFSGKKDWAYSIIENCIHIGVYKNKFLEMGDKLIKQLIFEATQKNFPVFNYISSCLGSPLAEPFLIKPFTKEQHIAMILGKMKVIMAIDFDELIRIFNKTGFISKWTSRKKAVEINQYLKNELFVFENRAIQCSLNEAEFFLGGGSVHRMLFGYLLPSSIANSLHIQLKEFKEMNEDTVFSEELIPELIQKVHLHVEPYL